MGGLSKSSYKHLSRFTHEKYATDGLLACGVSDVTITRYLHVCSENNHISLLCPSVTQVRQFYVIESNYDCATITLFKKSRYIMADSNVASASISQRKTFSTCPVLCRSISGLTLHFIQSLRKVTRESSFMYMNT